MYQQQLIQFERKLLQEQLRCQACGLAALRTRGSAQPNESVLHICRPPSRPSQPMLSTTLAQLLPHVRFCLLRPEELFAVVEVNA